MQPTPSRGMQDLMDLARTMREQLLAARDTLSGTLVTGSADGLVTVSMTAGGEFQAVGIDPSVIDPAQPQRLERLVLAALRDAAAAVQTVSEERFGSMAETLNAKRS